MTRHNGTSFSRLLGVLALAGLFSLGGCATNPVTGKSELSLVSESWELNVGAQQYAPLRQSQGGDYVADPQVQAYVNQVGQKLAAVSDRKLPYEFKVLNSSVPNAWALPGGKISINRGLLTELQSEAELAAVLGHEIVHAAARHGAQGMQRGLLLQGAVMATTIATSGERYANLAQIGASVGAQLVNQKYGRDAERESDHFGMKYMSSAGYDPQGAVQLQETFVRLSEGRNQDWLSGLFSSHPASRERVDNNARDAALLPKGGDSGRQRYQQKMAHLTKTKPAYEAYDEAQKALAEGNAGKARNLVQQAIKQEPKEGHFHSLLGDIEQGKKNWKGARGHYNKAIQLNKNFFYYYLQRGLVNEQLKANAAAKRDLERSAQLLPTADAYNSLGNIARLERKPDVAKGYYAKAAGHQSEAGSAALGSLLELDLADNPGNYLKIRHGLDNNGRLAVEIANPTPRDVRGVQVQVQYRDAAGQVRTVQKQLDGRLAAGESTLLGLGVKLSPELARTAKAQITAAQLTR